MSKKGKGFLTGLLVGTGLGVLLAPKKGKDSRADVLNLLNELNTKVDEIDLEDVKLNIAEKIEELTNEIKELDKEKLENMTKKQVNDLKLKADNLYTYVKDKNPAFAELTEDIKEETVNFLETTINKLNK